MTSPINWIRLIMTFLQNFPSVVLQIVEVDASGMAETVKNQNFTTLMTDINLQMKIKNKSSENKKYKCIIFITDL